MKSVCLSPLDGAYPSRLRSLARPPATITVRGGPLEADRVVAIVGSREAHPDAIVFARALAGTLAREGVVVASGGAFGVDAAVHEGVLEAGGTTWCVAGTGENHCYPPRHASLFERIADGPGGSAMVWPFPPDLTARARAFPERNRVLVALSDAVVVVQAGLRSGALSTAARAMRQRKPLWVVPVSPWLRDESFDFDGSRRLLDDGARPLQGPAPLLRSLSHLVRRGSDRAGSDAAGTLLAGLPAPMEAPVHLDEIAARAHLSPQAATAALLTLALENVVVEGPPGFFRRRDAI